MIRVVIHLRQNLVKNILYQQRSAGTKLLQAEAVNTGHTGAAHIVCKDTHALDPLPKLPREFPNSNRTKINRLDVNAKTDASVCLSLSTEDYVRGRLKSPGHSRAPPIKSIWHLLAFSISRNIVQKTETEKLTNKRYKCS